MKKIVTLMCFVVGAANVNAQSLSPRITNLEAVYSLKYHPAETTVGTVGSTGQIKAGHILTTKSFPAGVVGNDKLAFWNLASASDNSGQTSCTSGAAACDLTNNGTVTFAGSDIFGTARVATFNGTTQYLSSTDPMFDPGSVHFSCGGWFKATAWSVVPTQILFEQAVSGTQSFAVYLDNNDIVLFMANSPKFRLSASTLSAGWHHVVLRFDPTLGYTYLYIDGKVVGSASSAMTAIGASRFFSIGARYVSPLSFFQGSAQDVFFVNGVALSDQDIQRLASTRIDHNQAIASYRQEVRVMHNHLGAGTLYTKLPYLWYDASDSNSLFVDFSDLDSTDKLDIRLYSVQP